MIRFCPNCQTERGLDETMCDGIVNGQRCAWDLTQLPFHQPGWRPSPPNPPRPDATSAPMCPSGHSAHPGDLICPVCGVDLSGDTATTETSSSTSQTVIAGWQLDKKLASTSSVRERYSAVRLDDKYQAVLTLYAHGSEPDSAVYDVLRSLPRDHVPEIIQTGRWEDRAFEVAEELHGGTLADLGLLANDRATLSRVVAEIAKALYAFSQCGLRHRDLRPGAVLVRTLEPLDLVIISFGSARLSEFDLDIVSPLETTRYSAPEAVAGAVAAASDWWSLGILLLEQATNGKCFEGVNDQVFLINILTNGAPIPDGLDPSIGLLLRGLLTLDRRQRWGWQQVNEWLSGGSPPAAALPHRSIESTTRRTITLGGRNYSSPTDLALAAADAARWVEARTLLLRGDLATWADIAELGVGVRAEIGRFNSLEHASEDLRLALVLKVLNPAIPLVCRGEIVTPGWLLDHPDEGYELISGPVPEILKNKDTDLWLSRLKLRMEAVRETARHLEVTLNEDEFRVHVLSTSRSRLAAVWADRRSILPDTDHPGLIAILERRQTKDEDYILLLSADVGQFRTVDAIVSEAGEIAARAGVQTFQPEEASATLARPRRDIYATIESRVSGFSHCGLARIDEWADQFRLERRLPIARALALLAVPQSEWREPEKQNYVATLLEFFAKRITSSVLRGPLTRMLIGKTTARVDLLELSSQRRSSEALLDHLLLRNDQTLDLDPATFLADPGVERRLRTLHGHATLYRRDTGINGLYLGFPFLVMQEPRAARKPRIAPVLLWPVRLQPEVGARGRITVGFDRDREEVRLNPAFELILGVDQARRWRDVANDLLGRASLNSTQVMEAFGELARNENGSLVGLPNKEVKVLVGQDYVVRAGVFFHLAYVGQAVTEDIRQLKGKAPAGTSLETALRLSPPFERMSFAGIDENDRFFTAASDPSQEMAVLEARNRSGLLIEGPPGTGKSQSIVNMVSDAIGRGKTLLVVCQKQAALDVVRKRLIAEGLGDRIVMVTDENRDRQVVIRTIREQLDSLVGGAPRSDQWRPDRQRMAAVIEALENALNQHQSRLYSTDESSSLSYRTILADLIALDSGKRSAIEVPQLRPLLDKLNVGDVSTLEELCGPLATLWLHSNFEGSSLAILRPFGTDSGMLAHFESDFGEFVQAEKSHGEVIEFTPTAAQLQEGEPYRKWLRTFGSRLRVLDEGALERLSRWIPFFRLPANEPQVSGYLTELDQISEALRDLGTDAVDSLAKAAVVELGAEALEEWREVVDALSSQPSFFRRLSPLRWLMRYRLRSFIKARRLVSLQAFHKAIYDEVKLRPWRTRLESVRDTLIEPTKKLDASLSDELYEITRELRQQLAEAYGVAVILRQHPEPDAAFDVVSKGSTHEVGCFLVSVAEGCARFDARSNSLSALKRLEPWFEPQWIAQRKSTIVEDRVNPEDLISILTAIPHLSAYQRFRARSKQMSPKVLEIFRNLRTCADSLRKIGDIELDVEVRRTIRRESRLAWKARLELNYPELMYGTSELRAKAEALADADAAMRRLNLQLLVDGIDRSQFIEHVRDWEDVTRLTGQRSRRLREFIDRGTDLGLMTLRPVWLMNPDVASRVLPLRPGLFDTVIYDEASQVPVEFAIPTLYRSKTMIVSGDEKQMPPTSFFSSRVENDEAQLFEGDDADDDASDEQREEIADGWNRREIKDCPDLLQLAKTVLPITTLRVHYRSVYAELIQFSNAAFYSDRLSVPARHPDAEVRRIRPIEMISAKGTYDNQSNRAEAECVVDVLSRLWLSSPADRKSVGVVTFNRRQADLIEDMLEDRAESDPVFSMALAQERDRQQDGEDMGFFVKNVENVQGDERDVMVFSSTFGRNTQGTFRRAFGVLGQGGGERRLNVAVTRAREKVILITSMPIAEISDFLTTRRPAATPRDYLQAYFEYARMISAGELDAARALAHRLVINQSHSVRRQSAECDGFKASVLTYIESLGWAAVEVSDDGAFGLDFAIEDRRTGLYGIGIECDAPRHPLLVNARAREVWRPSVLRRAIPHVHRVSSHGWYHGPVEERASLHEAIRVALEVGEGAG